MSVQILELPPAQEAAARSLAIHEASHYLVASALNLNPARFLASTSAGVCFHRHKSFADSACCGWAGVCGEDLLGRRASDRTLPTVPVSNLREWFNQMMASRLCELSEADRNIIRAWPVFEACERAFRILSANLDLIEFEAERLLNESRQRIATSGPDDAAFYMGRFVAEQQLALQARQQQEEECEIKRRMADSVPIPGKFPASLGDFLFVIICKEDRTLAAMKRLRDFLRARERCGDSPAGSAHLNSLIEFYDANGFDRTAWLHLARAFLEWEKKNFGRDTEKLNTTKE